MTSESVEIIEDIGVDKPLSTNTNRFRLSSKSLFLTYPKCPWAADRLLEHFKSLFAKHSPLFIVVARELHKDGDPHLHAFISLECPFETRNPRAFDLHSEVQIEGSEGRHHVSFHPNIHSRIKSQYRVMKYVTKDGNFLSHGVDVKEFLSRAKTKRSTTPALVAQALMTGSTLREVNDKDPEFVMMNLKTLQTYQTQTQIWALQQKRSLLTTRPLRTSPTTGYESSWNIAISEWLNASIRKQRPRKSKQLWISSGPSAGKSTTILRLIRAYELNVYVWPVDEDYFDEWEDGAYDLIWLDEYKSQKTIQVINRIADGMPTSLKRKFKPPFTKFQNIPLIICSNGIPSENYHNKVGTVQLEALLARFAVIEVPSEGLIRLDFHDNTASPYDEYDIESLSSEPELGPDPTPTPGVATAQPRPGDAPAGSGIDDPAEFARSPEPQILSVPSTIHSPNVNSGDPIDPADHILHPLLDDASPSTPAHPADPLEAYTRKRIIREFFDLEASAAKR